MLRLQQGYRVSERRAVKALGAHRSAIRYRPKRPALDAPVRKRIEEIAAVRIRYGYRRIHVLLQREGWNVNLKRVYRIYCLAGLNLRSKRPLRRRMANHRVARPDVTQANDCWSMDFVSDALFNGKRFRALTVMDQYTRECLTIHADQHIKGEQVSASCVNLPPSVASPDAFRPITVASSSAKRSTNGHTSRESPWISPALDVLRTIPSSNRSTVHLEISASIPTGF